MNYQNGKIYIIKNHINDLVYIGSTTQTLKKRFSNHKAHMKHKQNVQIYKAMKELDIKNFYIELLEECPCDCSNELRKREGDYIKQYNSYNHGYNMKIAGLSPKESTYNWRKNNKEKYNEIQRVYNLKKKHCPVCKCSVISTFWAKHHKTKKHQRNVDNIDKLIVNLS